MTRSRRALATAQKYSDSVLVLLICSVPRRKSVEMTGSREPGLMNRREFLGSTIVLALAAATRASAARKWPLGLNTYCLRLQRWNDRQLIDYCVTQKLDAIFLQDSIDPGLMDPKHWAEVRAWSKDLGLHLETGGGAILPKTRDAIPQMVATLRKNIERASAMGSSIVRALLAGDRYHMPDDGPVA